MQKPLIYTACAVVIACGGLFAWNSHVDGCDRAVTAGNLSKIASCESSGALPQGARTTAAIKGLNGSLDRLKEANRMLGN